MEHLVQARVLLNHAPSRRIRARSLAMSAARAAVHGFNVASLGAAGFLCLAAHAIFLVTGLDNPQR